MHKIELRSKNNSKVLTGANAELLIDGKPIQGVTKVSIEVAAGDIAKATIEMVGTISVDSLAELKIKKENE